MKKFTAFLLVFIALQGAQARSIAGTLLHFENKSKAPAGITHTLDTYVTGSVVHRILSPRLPNVDSIQLVTYLDRDQIERIQVLIKKSLPVLIDFEHAQVKCFAPSSHVQKYTANNGRIFLKKGAVCDGGFQVNQQPSARKLVRVLAFLEKAAHDRLSQQEIKEKVDLLLN